MRRTADKTPSFPDVAPVNQSAHLCRLILAATPHLRHLRIHLGTYALSPMKHMAETLDTTPALQTLTLSAQADDFPHGEKLYNLLPAVLSRHPRLHAIRCFGAMVVFFDDIMAIGSHPSLAHIDLAGDLYYNDRGRTPLKFSHPKPEDTAASSEQLQRLCAHCALSSAIARLALLRHVRQQCVEADGQFFESSGSNVDIGTLIDELERSEARHDSGDVAATRPAESESGCLTQ